MNEDEDYNQLPTLDASAISDHEMFESWMRAGFTRREAMVLLLNNKRQVHEFSMAAYFHDKLQED